MWPFRRKKNIEPRHSAVSCPFCRSANTRLIAYHGTNQPDFARVWRGQHSLTYRCLDCGKDFYSEGPPEGVDSDLIEGDDVIDDEEALRAAEAEIKKQIEENDDRTCP